MRSRLRKAQVRAALFRKPPQLINIGRFTLLQCIGAGNMGEVYAAYDKQLDRKVAIKLVRTGANTAHADERLLREARLLAQVPHPNIVHVYDAGTFEGRVFIAMEFVRGKTMTEWLASIAGLPPRKRNRQILEHFMAAGRGLEAAHTAGVTHRDFKPDNILVGDDGRVRVVDFGLARAALLAPQGHDAPTEPFDPTAEIYHDASATLREAHRHTEQRALLSALTARGTIMGTPAYMAPEVFGGQPADHRSDQFSFCVALYEALHGERPFRGDDLGQLRDAILSGRLPARPLDQSVPAHIRRALRRGLATEAADRFPDMGELLGVLGAPSARERWAWPAVTLSSLALVALAVYSRPEDADACQDAGSELTEVWNAESRSRLEKAILQDTSRAYARDDVWPRVERGIKEYAGAWRQARQQKCLQRRDGLLSENMYDLSTRCLSRQRSKLESTLRAIEVLEPADIHGAVTAISELPAPEDCRPEELASGVPPPATLIEHLVHILDQMLDRAIAFEATGNYLEAENLAKGVADQATMLGYEPLLVRAWLAQGRIALNSGDYEASVQPLKDAASHGMKLAGMDAITVEAFARLLYAQQMLSNSSRNSDFSVPLMESFLERLPEGTFARALLLNNIGFVYMRNKEREQARAYFQRAVNLTSNDATEEGRNFTHNFAMVTEDAIERGKLMREVQIWLEDRLGPLHPHTLRQRQAYSSYIPDPKEGYATLEPACTGFQAHHGKRFHQQVHRCLYHLAFLAAETEDRVLAIKHLGTLIELPELDSNMDRLARGYHALFNERYEDSVSQFMVILEDARRNPPRDWSEKARVSDARVGLAMAHVESRARGHKLPADDQLISSVEESITILEEVTQFSYSSEHWRRLARARMVLAMLLADDAATRPAPASAKLYAQSSQLMAQAESWYRVATGYEERLRQLTEWRRTKRLDPAP